jgi:hypothetical protein
MAGAPEHDADHSRDRGKSCGTVEIRDRVGEEVP